ncbi:MAG TPA: hypothetical protein VGC19_07370 [Rhodanobacter sp.]
MNTPLPPDHDDELPGEAELAALYRKLPKSEPGPALDAAVLRAAAEALASANANPQTIAGGAQARKPRTRWLIPLSSAATLVLAAGLAWHMRGMPAAESALTKTASPQTAAPTNTPSVAAAPASPSPAPAPPSLPPPSKAAAPTEMLSEVTRAAHQTAPPMRIQDKLMSRASAMKPKKADVDNDAAAGTLAGITVAQPASEIIAAPPPPPEPSQRYADAARSLAPPPVAETSTASADEVAATGNEAEASRPAPAPMTAPAPALPDVTEKDLRDTRAQELDNIRRLFAAHRDDEAKARLEALQRLHPGQKLPADLRARLPGSP